VPAVSFRLATLNRSERNHITPPCRRAEDLTSRLRILAGVFVTASHAFWSRFFFRMHARDMHRQRQASSTRSFGCVRTVHRIPRSDGHRRSRSIEGSTRLSAPENSAAWAFEVSHTRVSPRREDFNTAHQSVLAGALPQEAAVAEVMIPADVNPPLAS